MLPTEFRLPKPVELATLGILSELPEASLNDPQNKKAERKEHENTTV